jgi:hypothetical protein
MLSLLWSLSSGRALRGPGGLCPVTWSYGGQMYPAPVGLLKQPTDSGRNSFGR